MNMRAVQTKRLEKYRDWTFRLSPDRRVKTKDEAAAFVRERGFVYFWPIRGTLLPSLWAAVAGDRPVADAHDDPGHITWGWKDSMLGSREWYYAKVLRKKATMISYNIAPYFYALSENYGSPEEDYLTLYQMGRMTQEAKQVYEALLAEGPLDTVALRKKARLSSPASESRFNRALADLQADFKILPVAVTEAGAWHYAFAYEIVSRHYPDLETLAHPISEKEARQKLAKLYFLSVGAARPGDLRKLFGWRPAAVERVINDLVGNGVLKRDLGLENSSGEFVALAELMD
jgi:hypothetical protein